MGKAQDAGLSNSLGAVGKMRDAFTAWLPQAQGAVNGAADTALGRLGEAGDLYQPAYDRGEQAGGIYSDSLGLNGAEGNQRARDTFQTGPGYEWQRDQASDLAARKASALGIAGSGNTLAALTSLGSNLANQEYGSWQNRLMGLGVQGQQAAGGMATALGNQANIDMQRGNSLAGFYDRNAGQIAGTYGAEADLYSKDADARQGHIQWQAGQVIPAGQAIWPAFRS